MSSAVAELEAGLQAMLSLKPPGVSGSRIQTLTALCLANIQVRLNLDYCVIPPR
jgi:protein NRD1